MRAMTASAALEDAPKCTFIKLKWSDIKIILSLHKFSLGMRVRHTMYNTFQRQYITTPRFIGKSLLAGLDQNTHQAL
jgi:hypothetical protein